MGPADAVAAEPPPPAPLKIALNPHFMMDVRTHLWDTYRDAFTDDQLVALATHVGKAIITSIVKQHRQNQALYAVLADE